MYYLSGQPPPPAVLLRVHIYLEQRDTKRSSHAPCNDTSCPLVLSEFADNDLLHCHMGSGGLCVRELAGLSQLASPLVAYHSNLILNIPQGAYSTACAGSGLYPQIINLALSSYCRQKLCKTWWAGTHTWRAPRKGWTLNHLHWCIS